MDDVEAARAYYRGDAGVTVRGRLRRGDEMLFEFVDAFAFRDGRIARLRTDTA